jgi:hypothetical protein
VPKAMTASITSSSDTVHPMAASTSDGIGQVYLLNPSVRTVLARTLLVARVAGGIR